MVLNFMVSVPLYFLWDSTYAGAQFVERHPWIPEWGISYHVGIDGISVFMVLLTTFLMPLALLASWRSIQRRIKEFVVLMLVVESALIGVFVAQDLFLFYLFWESSLIPMYFLIGIWGSANRIYASIKFFIYTMVGSVFMLAGILVLYSFSIQQLGMVSFDIQHLSKVILPLTHQKWLFLAFFLGFAIKVPLFPFHTWLPLAHVEAPTAGSVILAGVFLKMGSYGFLRFCLPWFPQAVDLYRGFLMFLALVGILYGAMMVLAQTDLKKIVAYSSVSHMGFVMLAIFAGNLYGMEGAVIQMVNHGISTSALFIIVGMFYERTHTRELSDYGGASAVVPRIALFFLPIVLSSLGLPGTNGFVGEFLILLGSFHAFDLISPQYGLLWTAFATTGVVLGAVYLLWTYQRAMHGEVKSEHVRTLPDLSLREGVVLFPLLVMIFWIGIYPQSFLPHMEQSIKKVVMVRGDNPL